MLKAIDFFCGAGGLTRGLLDAGLDVIAGIDNHAPCKATYEYEGNNTRPNGEPAKFLCYDVERLPPDRLAEEAEITPDDDSLVFAGCSPCQFWSKINTSREKSAASKALLGVFRGFVETFRPGYVVIENVPGLRTRRDEAGLTEFLNFLREAGYGYDEDNLSFCL